jgi:hypothetical protein
VGGPGEDDDLEEVMADAFSVDEVEAFDALRSVDESIAELELVDPDVRRWLTALQELVQSLTPSERRWLFSPFCHECGRDLPCADHVGKEQ